MTRWRNWFLGTLAAGLVFALAILAFTPSPVLVEIANVTHGPMRITVNAEGRTRVRERYIVSAPVMGRLGRIDLSEGDVVKPGTILTELIPAPMDTRSISQNRAALEAAEAESRAADAQVEQARATLDQAQRDRQRYDRLSETGVIAPKTLDDAVTAEAIAAKALEAAKFNANAARFRVETARSASYPRLMTPVQALNPSGYVLRRGGRSCGFFRRASASSRPARQSSRSAIRLRSNSFSTFFPRTL